MGVETAGPGGGVGRVPSGLPAGDALSGCGGAIERFTNNEKNPSGFRTFGIVELATYRSLGKRPEPEVTHEFF